MTTTKELMEEVSSTGVSITRQTITERRDKTPKVPGEEGSSTKEASSSSQKKAYY